MPAASALRPVAPRPVAPNAASPAKAPSSLHDRSAGAGSARRPAAPAAEADKPAAPSARFAYDDPRSSPAAVPEQEAPPPEARADDRIWRLQAALARRGFYRGPLDGLASPRTVQAIRGYQLSLRDPPSGVLTQIEIVRLLNNW
jgi:peptidoglycan hydrolase-like protein with peptidoglycan-binding domain